MIELNIKHYLFLIENMRQQFFFETTELDILLY